MTPPTPSELTYEWNEPLKGTCARRPRIQDETLRDGLQSPSVQDPGIASKRDLLHRLSRLGVDSVNLGIPGAGPQATASIKALLTEIRDYRLPIVPSAAVRTVERDLIHLAEIQQKAGLPLEAGTFLGSSPIRMDVESWDLAYLLDLARKAVRFCRLQAIPVMMVTEDTTRSRPEHLKALYTAALDEGAQAICLTDTCGHATPSGVRNLVRFTRREILGSYPQVRLDWHGHNDRGLGLANAIAAFEEGADCIHASVLGIGERCGNVPLDQLLANLSLMGLWPDDLTGLPALGERVSELCGVPIPINYPMLGRDAFRTGTGVHAAAIAKAMSRGDAALADAVYSSVPASMVGRRQEIEIGPLAGKSNVIYWLEMNGHDATPERIECILSAAKKSHRILTDSEIVALL